MRQCRKCPAMIQDVRMYRKDGTPLKVAPIETETNARGNVRVEVVDGEIRGRVLAGGELERARNNGEELFLNHFVTCPEAEGFRPGGAWRARGGGR